MRSFGLYVSAEIDEQSCCPTAEVLRDKHDNKGQQQRMGCCVELLIGVGRPALTCAAPAPPDRRWSPGTAQPPLPPPQPSRTREEHEQSRDFDDRSGNRSSRLMNKLIGGLIA